MKISPSYLIIIIVSILCLTVLTAIAVLNDVGGGVLATVTTAIIAVLTWYVTKKIKDNGNNGK